MSENQELGGSRENARDHDSLPLLRIQLSRNPVDEIAAPGRVDIPCKGSGSQVSGVSEGGRSEIRNSQAWLRSYHGLDLKGPKERKAPKVSKGRKVQLNIHKYFETSTETIRVQQGQVRAPRNQL